jgi:1,2-phenylacetyl-CoA epoxidase catalytic subunit
MASVSQVSHIAPEQLAPWTEEQVQQHLAAGKLVEGIQHMSPKYLEGMRRILTVSADTEFVSAPSYLRAAQHAPALNNFGSAMSIIQDELAHAHIGYRLLGDLGVDMDELIYERPARSFKYPYAFDVPLNSWVELVCANALYDQAGFVLLSDVFQSSTFGPWKRALAKVDKEETFHLRHGRTWIRKLVKDPSGKAEVQAAIDWMFILTLEWFGLPDELKQHSEQLDYGFKGKSNDQLRQWWMSEVVPFMEELGIRVPAHKAPPSGAADQPTKAPPSGAADQPTKAPPSGAADQPTKAPPSGAADQPNDAIERDGYVIDCPFPAAFDEEKREWLLDNGPISWDDVIARWRARGPMNDDYVRTLQRGYQTTSLRRAP